MFEFHVVFISTVVEVADTVFTSIVVEPGIIGAACENRATMFCIVALVIVAGSSSISIFFQ
jgi:hypothetical protein